jgi:glycosyltransferase involved in cell wall biosynthesis
VLEAWSAFKPVVVTEIGGPKHYVEHEVNGLKIFPVDSALGIDRIYPTRHAGWALMDAKTKTA